VAAVTSRPRETVILGGQWQSPLGRNSRQLETSSSSTRPKALETICLTWQVLPQKKKRESIPEIAQMIKKSVEGKVSISEKTITGFQKEQDN
jgi:hypothetical protein